MDELNRLIDSRSGFHDVLHLAFANMDRAGCREVFLADENFEDWPLGTPETVALLTAWARPHREFHVLASRFDGFSRHHPRWVTWRRRWSHVVQCRSPGDRSEHAGGGAVAMPSLLVLPGLVGLRLTDRTRFRGRATTHGGEIQSMRQQFDAISQQSFDAFAATTLGL